MSDGTRRIRYAVGALLVLALAGCGEDTGSADLADRPSLEDGPDEIAVTREDGSSFVVDGMTLECVPFESDPSVERLSASNERVMNKRGTFVVAPWFQFEVTPAEVAAGRTYALPYSQSWDDPKDMVFFLVDSGTRSELSSAVEESTGSVEVIEATCDPRPRLVLSVDATLGSEIGGPPSRVEGELTLSGTAAERS